MNKHYREYWEKLLETVAFSYGKVCLYELVPNEHKHYHPTERRKGTGFGELSV